MVAESKTENTLARKFLTQERLKELLRYDPISGQFSWAKSRRGTRVGDLVKCKNMAGYRIVRIDNVLYRCCRLAFLYMDGAFPCEMVDHKNCDKGDDSWKNLRLATPSQNCANKPTYANNSLGIKGVYCHQGGFRARICKNGQVHDLGTFRTAQEAGKAYALAAVRLYGEFANSDPIAVDAPRNCDGPQRGALSEVIHVSVSDNINAIEGDLSTFLDGLKGASGALTAAVAAGGKSLSADAAAVVGVASAAASAAAKVPGTVGTYASEVGSFIPFAQELIALFTQPSAATTTTATSTTSGASAS